MQHRLPRRVVVLVNAGSESREQAEPSAVPSGASLPAAARAVMQAIEGLEVEVSEKRITTSLSGLAFQIGRLQADVVFNLVESLHDDPGRAWQLPALLDRHRIAYTGNAALPLRICRQKDKARRALSKECLSVAPDFGRVPGRAPISVWIFPDPITGYAVSTGAIEGERAEVESLAYKAFSTLGGTGHGRVDMRIATNGKPIVIDVVPNCDLHPDGDLTVAAKSLGWDYQTLISSLLDHALRKQQRLAIEERSQI